MSGEALRMFLYLQATIYESTMINSSDIKIVTAGYNLYNLTMKVYQ